MKKLFFVTTLFFWSMFFPSLSFNQFTCELVNSSSSYQEFFSTNNGIKKLENAEYKFRLIDNK